MLLLKLLTVLILAGGFLWGLLVFGAPETHQLYRLFLVFMTGTGLVLAGVLGRKAFRDKLALIGLGIGAFLLLQVFFRGTVTGLGYVHLGLGWAAFLVSYVIGREDLRSARRLFLFLVLVGALEALVGLAQSVGGMGSLGGSARGLGHIATGTLFNRNHFAGLMNMVIPLALGGLFASYVGKATSSRHRSESASWAWMILLSCGFMGLAILLSQSRGGTISLLLSLVLAAVLLRWYQPGREGPKLGALAAVTLLTLVLGLGLYVGMDALLARFGMSEAGLQGRSVIYEDSLNLIAEEPLLGVGPHMYQWRFRPHQSVDQQVWVDYAHNDYLQTAAEWGIPLALLFWGFVIWVFLQSIRTFLESREPWRQGMAFGCGVAIFSILLHSFVDFNLYIPSNLMLFCGILGLGASLGRRT